MKKTFTILIAALLLLTMLTNPLIAVGQSKDSYVEFTPSDFSGQGTSSTGSSISATTDGVTFASDKGYGTTQIRVYSGGKITISSANTITKIEFTFSSSNTGGLDATYSNLSTNKWEKTTSSQARFTKIKVTYSAATTYTVTISNTIANGSVSATPTSAAQNATITLTPSANSGYKLSGWNITKTSDGTASGITPTGPNAQGKYTFSMPAYNVTVGATFSQTYTVTCATGLANGSISAEPATAAAGETITVTANPAANYKLKTVSVTETGGSNTVTPTIDGNSATFTMPAYGVTVSADFVRIYHVTYDANTTDYTGTTTDANVYETGNNATVQANGFSKDGYTFSTWNTQADGNGTNYAPGSTYTIGSADVTLYAKWTIAQEEVTIGSVSGATISAVYSGGSITSGSSYDCGTVIQLRADGLASGKGIVWDVYKTGDATTKVTVTNNSFTLPAYPVTISGTVGDLFVKYTSATLVEGDFILVSDDKNKALTNSVSNSVFGCTAVNPVDNQIISTSSASIMWHLAKINNTNYWTIYNASVSSYAGGTTTKNQGALLASVTDYAKWTVTIGEGTYDFENYGRANGNSDTGNKWLRYNYNNGNGDRWACYASGTGQALSLFKKSASYSVDVTTAANGVITASTSGQSPIVEGANANIRSGAVVTLTATPDDGYIANAWTVYKTSDESTTVTVTSNQFTMPDYPVTVTTSFRSVAPATLTYSANGVTTNVSLTEGDVVTLKTAGEITVPSGYTFVGWSESASDFSDIKTGSYTVMSTITLYAVFSANKPATYSFEITASDFNSTSYDANNNEKTTTATSIETNYTIDVNWTSNQIMLSSSAMQWQKSNGYIYNSTDLGTIKSVSITSSTGSFTTLYGTSANTGCDSETVGNGFFKTSVGSATGSTSSVVVTFEKNAPFYFTRVIGTETAEDDITINGPTIIENGKSLNMNGHTLECNNPTLLVIEDGGQLILAKNTTAKATLQKTTAASSSSKAAANNLYAIASPVDGIKISSFAKGTHNVYRYDGPTSVWQEYRNDDNEFDDLEIGRGYLYRSSVEGIELAGNVTGGNADGEVSYSLDYNGSGAEKFRGLNLVGNPFTHNITWSNLTLDNVETGGCYVLNEDEDPENANHGKWQAVVSGSVTIKPMQAFFVQATAESASITFKNTVGGGAKGLNYANDNIMLSVKNGKCSDEAYVLFKEGHGLNKIEHRNAEIPMLYVMNHGQNFAIADMSDDTRAINLGFEAKTIGQYTISLKAEGQYSHMSLYDKVTNTETDMLLEDSYTFVGTPNDRKDRFVLNLNYKAANIDTESDIFAYQSGSDIMVRGNGELQIFDVTGRMVMTQRVNGVETVVKPAQGVYIFRLIGNEVKTQKIVVR